MYRDFASQIKYVLHGIDGCKSLDIVRSTLIGNERWKTLGEGAV